MPNNDDYKDLFASYERRSSREKTHDDENSADRVKNVGYTTSSSYSKPPRNENRNFHADDKVIERRREKQKRNPQPEKSPKTYYGGYERSSAKREPSGTQRRETAESKVKYKYDSNKDFSYPANSAKNETRSFDSSFGAFTNMSKDEYRKRYEQHSAEQNKSRFKYERGKGTAKKAYGENESGSSARNNIKEKVQNDKRTQRRLIFFASVLVATVVLSLVTISCIDDVLAINRHSEKAVTITIDKQVNTNEVVKMLKKDGLIKNRIFCTAFAKMKGFTNNYETGVFYLKKDMGLEGMILTLKSNSQTDETVTITFPEGYSIIEIAKKLEANNVCTSKNFIDTLENFNFDYDFLSGSLKTDKRKYQYLEGYLFPSTYDFYVGESPSSVIKKMLDAFDSHYNTEFRNKAKGLNLSCDEVVTLASIVQREAANTKQMSQIAGVLYNRIENQSEYPRLECDSTTDFLNKDLSKFLKAYPDKGTIDYYALYYSTYSDSFKGLPAGSICNPGADAINAVLNLKKSDYYFFCHDSSGKIHLAKTLIEFENIKSEYNITTDETN